MNPRSLEPEYLFLQCSTHTGFQRPLLHHHGRSQNSPEHSSRLQHTHPHHRTQIGDALGQFIS